MATGERVHERLRPPPARMHPDDSTGRDLLGYAPQRMLGRIGQYQLLSELAQGGMGTVYRAHDPGLGRDVALKLLRTDRPMDARGLERFRREVLTLAQFQHPNVVRVHGAGTHQGLPFFVQELVEGQPLDRRLQDSGPLPPREAADAIRKLAAALQAAHDTGILHRDVKPANVIMTPQGEPILIDFGVAKNAALALSQSGLTKTGQGVGSPGYWSPEQACGELDQIGPRSDVYSLGATLYALLVGRAPFEGQGVAGNLMLTINEPPQPPSELRSDVPADLEAICLKCLEKEPERRYATARDLEHDLQRVLDGDTPLARGGPTAHARARARKLRLVATALAVPVLLALAVLALPPSVEIRSPSPGTSVPGGRTLTVEILASGFLPVREVEINETPATPATPDGEGTYTASLENLAEGEHTLTATARGLLRSATASVTVRVDSTAPILSVTAPLDYSVEASDDGRVTLRGHIDDASTVRVSVTRSGAPSSPGNAFVNVTPGETFALQASLTPGINLLELTCVDAAGNPGPPVRLHVARPPPKHDTEFLLEPYRVKGQPKTYLITSTLRVSKRQRLVLPAGTTLRFSPTAGLVCRGELWALGTKDSRVRFLPASKRWEGIQVLGSQAKAVVAWSEIEYAIPDPVRHALAGNPEFIGKQGGGFTVLGGAYLLVVDCNIRRCAVRHDNRGGGIHVEGEDGVQNSVVLAIRTNIERCEGKQGGGIWAGPRTTVTLSGCTFSLNHAVARGGGLVVEGPEGAVRLTAVRFLGNTSDRFAGGAALDRSARVEDCLFLGNKAAEAFGGLMVRAYTGPPLALLRVRFEKNKARLQGGGASICHGATLRACEFLENSSGLGGGLSFGPSNLTCEDSLFLNNQASQSSGGGVHSTGSRLSFTSTRFIGNSAVVAGGGIYVGKASVAESAEGSALNLESSEFERNTAQRGADLFLESDTVFDQGQVQRNSLNPEGVSRE